MMEFKILSKMSALGEIYLSKVSFINVQGFDNFTLHFSKKQVLMFSLFLGNNSAGKTAFLRCLALGMSDETGAAGLLENFRPSFIRQGEIEAVVNIELITQTGLYRLVTTVKRIKTQERLRQHYYYSSNTQDFKEIPPEEWPWDQLFVCGYGAGRVFSVKTQDYESYRVRDAIGTLFRYDYPMQHPELSLHRLIRATKRPDKTRSDVEQDILQDFKLLMSDIFMLTGPDQIELTEKGIEVISGKKRFPLLAHGDGYKNTAAWILDMLTWKMLAKQRFHPKEMTGIVLLDEVEQHLHPRWQRHIVRLLRQQFPKIQWIATTHSPLCAAGTADLPDEEAQLLRFERGLDDLIQLITLSSLRGLKADQVLTSSAFDLPTTRNPEIAEQLNQFSLLYLKASRTPEEEKEFIALRDYLEQYLPESAEDSDTRIMQHQLKKMLNDLTLLSSGV
jgi:predicted ATPase